MIILRQLQKKDLHFVLEVRNDTSTRSFLENDSIFSYEECLNWFNKKNPQWYIIEVKGVSVGYLRTNGKDEVGCDIHPNFRRMGYAKKAYEYYLKDKKHASLWVFEDNFAKKLYEDIGFKETKEFKYIRNRKYIQMIYEKK